MPSLRTRLARRPSPPARRLACAICHLESGTRVVPLTTHRPTGITLRKGADGEMRCQFCWTLDTTEEE